MNERITELWDKAAERDDIFQHARHEQFAELILIEVRLLIADERIEYHSDEADDALVSVLISIEKHFGVEE